MRLPRAMHTARVRAFEPSHERSSPLWTADALGPLSEARGSPREAAAPGSGPEGSEAGWGRLSYPPGPATPRGLWAGWRRARRSACANQRRAMSRGRIRTHGGRGVDKPWASIATHSGHPALVDLFEGAAGLHAGRISIGGYGKPASRRRSNEVPGWFGPGLARQVRVIAAARADRAAARRRSVHGIRLALRSPALGKAGRSIGTYPARGDRRDGRQHHH